MTSASLEATATAHVLKWERKLFARMLNAAIRSRISGGDARLLTNLPYRCYAYELFVSIIEEGLAVGLLVLGVPVSIWLQTYGGAAPWLAFVPSVVITALVGIRILLSSLRYVGRTRVDEK